MNKDKNPLSNVELLGHLAALGNKIDGLKDLTELELKGVNKRLDTVNGRLGRHDEEIETLQLNEARKEGAKEAMEEFHKAKWTVLAGIAIACLVSIGSGIVAVIF